MREINETNGIKICGMGRAVPAHVVTNDDLARIVDTNDEWITTRTGIRRRHHCTDETLTGLCAEAARAALAKAGVAPEQIGAVIVATITSDNIVPSTACLMQRELGLREDTLCFDLNAACSGFLYALHTMECLLAASPRKFGLVIGGEALSRILNWEDRSTCILFGDGAGAAVVESRPGWPSIGAVQGVRGDDEMLLAPGPGRGVPSVLSMEGTKVFKFAVDAVPACIDELLAKHGRAVEDIDFFVFHQANARIIDLVVRRYQIPEEKYYKNIDEYGNTSAASIPLALSELESAGRIGPGSRVLLVGFGGGLTWGGAIVEFA
jgi:3-oxoacyl-[acyl-carrier-protein] synthase-3